jgi:AcrR family transcriptional regulator
MVVPKRQRDTARLSAEDWADAALEAIGEGGLAAVAVEPLAARLGVTKGSFYWHFENRAALIQAALDRWERVHTDGVILLMRQDADPRAQLTWLLRTVVGLGPIDKVEIALLANADHPIVAATTARVTERRIAAVAELYEQVGHDPEAARRRAVIGVATFLGHLQLARASQDSLPQGDAAWERHLDELVALLVD